MEMLEESKLLEEMPSSRNTLNNQSRDWLSRAGNLRNRAPNRISNFPDVLAALDLFDVAKNPWPEMESNKDPIFSLFPFNLLVSSMEKLHTVEKSISIFIH